jgi:hypothetical protein
MRRDVHPQQAAEDLERVRALLARDDRPTVEHPVDWDLFEAILGKASAVPSPRRRVPRRAVAALAALPIALGGYVLADDPDPAPSQLDLRSSVERRTGSGELGSAKNVLLAATRTAAATSPNLDASPRYQRLISAYLNTTGGDTPASVLVPETVEWWIAQDGSGELKRRFSAPIWPSDTDRERWLEQAASPTQTDIDDHFEPNELALPEYAITKPKQLLAQLREASPRLAPHDRSAWIFNSVHELLVDPAVPPSAHRALLRALAQVPGLTVTGHVTDQLGRSGVALGIDSSYAGHKTRYEMILDPTTGLLLEYQSLLLEPAPFVAADPPTQLSFEIVATRVGGVPIGETPSVHKTANNQG